MITRIKSRPDGRIRARYCDFSGVIFVDFRPCYRCRLPETACATCRHGQRVRERERLASQGALPPRCATCGSNHHGPARGPDCALPTT